MENLHSQIRTRPSERPLTNKSKRILLIDDEPNSVIPRGFARAQCHVVHCDCVRKAWNCVYPHRPDAIVFRLRKCDQSALADLHECRALAGSVPIVIVTSLQLNGDLLKTFSRGTAAVIGGCTESSMVAEALRCFDGWTITH